MHWISLFEAESGIGSTRPLYDLSRSREIFPKKIKNRNSDFYKSSKTHNFPIVLPGTRNKTIAWKSKTSGVASLRN